VTVVHNTYPNKQGVPAVLTNDLGATVREMQRAIDSGALIYVGFSSKKTLMRVQAALEFGEAPVIVHHAEVAAPLEVEKWKESHILVSPQVVHAVSCDFPEGAANREVFAVIDNTHTMNALEAFQQLHRVRHFRKLTACVTTRQGSIWYARPEQTLQRLRSGIDLAGRALQLEMREDPLSKAFEGLHMNIRFVDDNLKTDTGRYLLELLQGAGYAVSDERVHKPEPPDLPDLETDVPCGDDKLEALLDKLQAAEAHGTRDPGLIRQLQQLQVLGPTTAYMRRCPEVWRAAAVMLCDDRAMTQHFKVCVVLCGKEELQRKLDDSTKNDFAGMLLASDTACALALLELGELLDVPCGFALSSEEQGLPDRYGQPLEAALGRIGGAEGAGNRMTRVNELVQLIKKMRGLKGKRWTVPAVQRSYGEVVGLLAAGLSSWFGSHGSSIITSSNEARAGQGRDNTNRRTIYDVNAQALTPHLALLVYRNNVPSQAVSIRYADAVKQAATDAGRLVGLGDGRWLFQQRPDDDVLSDEEESMSM
jgi:hypothetical protein